MDFRVELTCLETPEGDQQYLLVPMDRGLKPLSQVFMALITSNKEGEGFIVSVKRKGMSFKAPTLEKALRIAARQMEIV